MKDYLTFQLYGPLASWGDQAVGGVRPSTAHPSRSALLGLLAAALGIPREADDKHQALSDACHFGVKLLQPGLLLRDYHTTQVPPGQHKHLFTRKNELNEAKIETILSTREYQQDAFALVAVWLSTMDFSLEQIKNALLNPIFHLYLGRKSCPIGLPLNPLIFESTTLKEALDGYKFYEEDIHWTIDTSQIRYFWEENYQTGLKPDFQTTRYDQPLSRSRWQFTSRTEYVALVQEE